MAELLTKGSEVGAFLAGPPCDDEDENDGDDIHHTYYDEQWVCLSEKSSFSFNCIKRRFAICSEMFKKTLTNEHYDPAR